LLSLALSNVVQSSILLSLGWLMGARYPAGLTGILLLFLSAALLSTPFAALSSALGLIMRQGESVIGAVNFILWPLTFLSPIFMTTRLMPHWIQIAARFNPVGWAATAARSGFSVSPNYATITTNLASLLVFTAFSGWLATKAFGAYQKSL
jgi:ABC-2 type transport system permease protein